MLAYTQNQSFCRGSEREDDPIVAQASSPAWLKLSFGMAVVFIATMGIIDVVFVVLFLAAMLNR